MATGLGRVGSGVASASGTSLAVTATQNIPSGTILVLGIGFDNPAQTSMPSVTVSAVNGVAWSAGLNSQGQGVSTTAGSGVWHLNKYLMTTADITSGATICTITFGVAVPKCAAIIAGVSNGTTTGVSASAVGTSAAGAPSAAGASASTDDVAVGFLVGETNVAPTGDSDTTNGSWSAIQHIATSGGGATANMLVGHQFKDVTASGNQTYNPTTANDSIASVVTVPTGAAPPASADLIVGIPI